MTPKARPAPYSTQRKSISCVATVVVADRTGVLPAVVPKQQGPTCLAHAATSFCLDWDHAQGVYDALLSKRDISNFYEYMSNTIWSTPHFTSASLANCTDDIITFLNAAPAVDRAMARVATGCVTRRGRKFRGSKLNHFVCLRRYSHLWYVLDSMDGSVAPINYVKFHAWHLFKYGTTQPTRLIIDLTVED